MAILRQKDEETRNAKGYLEDEIYNLIFESNKQVENDKIAQKILLSGENGLGKTSLSLALFTEDIGENDVIFNDSNDIDIPEKEDITKSDFDSMFTIE